MDHGTVRGSALKEFLPLMKFLLLGQINWHPRQEEIYQWQLSGFTDGSDEGLRERGHYGVHPQGTHNFLFPQQHGTMVRNGSRTFMCSSGERQRYLGRKTPGNIRKFLQ